MLRQRPGRPASPGCPLGSAWGLARAARLTDWTQIVTSRIFWTMKKIAAAKFKEQCLSILDHLEPDGIVITKHGKPVARVLPAERASSDLIGALRGRIRVKGEILATGAKWSASG